MAAVDGANRGKGVLWPLVQVLLRVPCFTELADRNLVVRMMADGKLDELKYAVAALIEATEGDWAQYEPDIRLEFVLSRELLNIGSTTTVGWLT